jgi:hypothetical protein
MLKIFQALLLGAMLAMPFTFAGCSGGDTDPETVPAAADGIPENDMDEVPPPTP